MLAELAAKHGVRPDLSRILGTNALLTAFNLDMLGERQRFVDLSCGHVAITSNNKAMTCPRCVEMIRRGYDYEGWINNREHSFDGMTWREDPCRTFNERTDLVGNFLDEPS